jgi:decaprenyl-phosphate phosphoribosyltransferase
MTETSFSRFVRPYLRIARFDHWVKNVFVLPGLAFSVVAKPDVHIGLLPFIIGMLSVGAIASANYIINEYLDAQFDRHHPHKKHRAGAQGHLNGGIVLLQYLLFAAVGLGLAATINYAILAASGVLLISGILYNVQPFRLKDRVFVDVLSESLNNPIRFVIGWYMWDASGFPPSSILVSYWMGGAYLMGMKRYAEYRDIGNSEVAAKYRRSFHHYTERLLLVSSFFYALNSTLFLGVFLIKYRVEYILTFPLVGLLFASYFDLAMKQQSAAQAPEKLYRERTLVVILGLLIAVFMVLSFIRLPLLETLLVPLRFGGQP